MIVKISFYSRRSHLNLCYHQRTFGGRLCLFGRHLGKLIGNRYLPPPNTARCLAKPSVARTLRLAGYRLRFVFSPTPSGFMPPSRLFCRKIFFSGFQLDFFASKNFSQAPNSTFLPLYFVFKVSSQLFTRNILFSNLQVDFFTFAERIRSSNSTFFAAPSGFNPPSRLFCLSRTDSDFQLNFFTSTKLYGESQSTLVLRRLLPCSELTSLMSMACSLYRL